MFAYVFSHHEMLLAPVLREEVSSPSYFPVIKRKGKKKEPPNSGSLPDILYT